VGGVRRFEPSLARAGRVSATAATVRVALSLIVISSLTAALTACGSGNGEKLGERVVPFGQPVPKGGGVYRIGSAYQVDGVWYQPKEDPAYDRVGIASWYGELFHGRRTANGEIYDMDRLSAAHPTLPLPVYARVTNLQNGRSIIVRVNDRGPYANDRIIDLSRRSAELLGYRDKGTAQVRVQFLARAPLNGDDSYERRYLANQSWMTYAAKDRRDPVSVGSLPKQPVAAKNSGWKTETKQTETVARNDPPPVKPAEIAAPTGRILIQAGSFKSKDNADKARSLLSEIAPVDVAPVAVGADTYFRVRIGPFSTDTDAQSALARANEAGYSGAKIVSN
jgi:peptidoglycan lytic transglycosylase